MNQRQFTAVPDEQWTELARAWFNERNGLPAPSYDPNIARSFSLMDGPIPALWPQFAALARIPLLVIRGANSDILSERTLDEMRARHPRLTAITVANQGHAPLLKDAPTIGAIAEFLARADATVHGEPQVISAVA
jgi:pimeloyl-ACP methyl ester carboxylesterase